MKSPTWIQWEQAEEFPHWQSRSGTGRRLLDGMVLSQ